jgi:Arc/MetJ-type ribon-helix-helix transcriptional regulator
MPMRHPYTIRLTSKWMVNLLTRPHAKPPDSEKLTINLGFVDLGSIDLLVRDGFYSNRSDFIRTAVRNQLASHAETSKKAASRLTLELGLRTFAREDLEAAQAAGEKLRIRVLGLAIIADDVTPDLAQATIESLTVLGALHAPAAVKAALADRLR